MPDIKRVSSTQTETTLEVICPHCKQPKQLTVVKSEFAAWLATDKLIQQAMPSINADDRELLITGICPLCWTALFGPEPDEPGTGDGEQGGEGDPDGMPTS